MFSHKDLKDHKDPIRLISYVHRVDVRDTNTEISRLIDDIINIKS